MNINSLGLINPLSTIGSRSPYNGIGNIYQTDMPFYNLLQSQQVNGMKQEIYNQFGIEVGDYSDNFGCYIPSEVLYRMNLDTDLKEKVFGAIEKYSGEEFRKSITGQGPAVSKCTLVFDENGDMTATLETGKAKRNAGKQNTNLLYQNFLMQQAARMSYQTNLYSGYRNLYGLNGLNGLNGINSFNMMQNFPINW